ncbi:uncharacterized protein LOC112889717 isoform X2 [Panicum hallii]|jgi:hypothetical protein|nr:uncharacterized protein LOC112889717 isoform X2 [Panicum hallii]XP_025812260.1 uncharacterized protein LOC112889717 isoform X2 [Panicum hallii]
MERGGADGAVVLVGTGLVALTLTSAVSAYRAAAAGDAGTTAFVAASYSTLLLLFRCLRAYERLPPPAGDAAAADGNGRRARLRREVWALCTLLTVMFAWKVAAAMPSWPAAATVWAMAALTAAGGCVALFHHRP